MEQNTLHFRGRLDHQVKIRGFRVEIQGVENALDRVIQKARVVCGMGGGRNLGGTHPLGAFLDSGRLGRGGNSGGNSATSSAQTVASTPVGGGGRRDRESSFFSATSRDALVVREGQHSALFWAADPLVVREGQHSALCLGSSWGSSSERWAEGQHATFFPSRGGESRRGGPRAKAASRTTEPGTSVASPAPPPPRPAGTIAAPATPQQHNVIDEKSTSKKHSHELLGSVSRFIVSKEEGLLVAFLQTDKVDTTQYCDVVVGQFLYQELSQILPRYALPSEIILLPELPIIEASGKVDRTQLASVRSSVAPRSRSVSKFVVKGGDSEASSIGRGERGGPSSMLASTLSPREKFTRFLPKSCANPISSTPRHLSM